jgi:hypothetical protein
LNRSPPLGGPRFSTALSGSGFKPPALPVVHDYFDGELSSDAAGIIATMFALSKLFSIENIDETDRFVELYLKFLI